MNTPTNYAKHDNFSRKTTNVYQDFVEMTEVILVRKKNSQVAVYPLFLFR